MACDTKHCKACKEWLPEDAFRLRNRRGNIIRNYQCIACQRVEDHERNRARRDALLPGATSGYVRPAREVVCDTSLMIWDRPADAPRLQLFGLVGVEMAA